SVSVAHAAASWGESEDYSRLQGDCTTFTELVRGSDTLCVEGKDGIYSFGSLQNFSSDSFFKEFNASKFNFGYRIFIQCVDPGTGNLSLRLEINSSEMPDATETACCHTCVNVDRDGAMMAARVTITVWQADA
ncbi:MAG: hypothetical protein PHU53_02970, partial [Thermoplasmata archaeon]|nr:hypothetical protein [Thermoplasmata archaeon]